MSPRLYGIRLPDGKLYDDEGRKYSRQQVLVFISWLPVGSKIEPDIPQGNPMAYALLDHLANPAIG